MFKKLNKLMLLSIAALPLISIISCKTETGSQDQVNLIPTFSFNNLNLKFNEESNKYWVKIIGTNLTDNKNAYTLTLNSEENNLLIDDNSQWVIAINESKTELTLTYNGNNLTKGTYNLLAKESETKVTITTINPEFTREQNSLIFEKIGNENKYTTTILGENLTDNTNDYVLTVDSDINNNLLIIQSSEWSIEIDSNKNKLFLTYNGNNLTKRDYTLLAKESETKVNIKFIEEETTTSNPSFIEKQNNLTLTKELNQNNYIVRILGSNFTINPNYYELTLGLDGNNLLAAKSSQWSLSTNENNNELTLTYEGSNTLLAGYYKLIEKQNNTSVIINLAETINWIKPENVTSRDEALKVLIPIALTKAKDELWKELVTELGENFDKTKINFIVESGQIGKYNSSSSLFNWLVINITLKFKIDNNEREKNYEIWLDSDLKELFPNGIRTW